MRTLSKICFAALLLCLCACASDSKNEPISILAPQGAPALATLPFADQETVSVDYVSGSDPLSAELIKNDSAYDVIIAPINLGTKLIEKDNTPYRLAAVITWGNLYIVGEADYQNGDAFAAFGEAAVPGKILTHYADIKEVTYFNSVQDVQTQLLSGKAKAGLLAEPAATATIAKAKEKGKTLTVLQDLQEKETVDGQKGYPQAAVFVKDREKSEAVLKHIEQFLNEAADEEQISAWIEQLGVEQLGIPNAKIALSTWERQNLKYADANTVKNDIVEFLKLFQIVFHDNMLI